MSQYNHDPGIETCDKGSCTNAATLSLILKDEVYGHETQVFACQGCFEDAITKEEDNNIKVIKHKPIEEENYTRGGESYAYEERPGNNAEVTFENVGTTRTTYEIVYEMDVDGNVHIRER